MEDGNANDVKTVVWVSDVTIFSGSFTGIRHFGFIQYAWSTISGRIQDFF